MTIATQTSKAAFSGNGVSAVFPLPFPFLRNADIKVLLVHGGYETPLEQGTHYALSGAGNAAGGSLTMQTPPATGQTLVAYRAPDIVQEVDYVENSAFPAETHEAALDLLTMICQSLQEQIDRAVLYPVSTPEGDILDSRMFLSSTAQSRDAARASEQNAAASANQAATAAAQARASAATVEELAATADALVKVSLGDTAGGSLSAKLLAGNGLAEGIENPGGEEALRLSVALAASSGLEFEAGLLRVQAGTGLVRSVSGLAANVGAGAGQLVQINESGQLPAVSGALLTGLAAAQISGLQTLPAGAVIFHASSTVPAGYLECNGAAVSRTAYADLFAVIGTAHGYGDASSTFNLPDLRGRFVRGWDHAIARDLDRATRTAAATGGATGDAVGSVQADQYKSHTHTYPLAASNNVVNQPGVGKFDCSGSAPSASSGGNETRPVNINLMACIKY